jgi:hypothetical protein
VTNVAISVRAHATTEKTMIRANLMHVAESLKEKSLTASRATSSHCAEERERILTETENITNKYHSYEYFAFR